MPRRRSKSTTYGQRGGTGATAGRKAETLYATIDGVTYKRRVFFGQRWMVISLYDNDPQILISTFHDYEDAKRHFNQTVKMNERVFLVIGDVK